ncbi:hypothetical protein [Butyrivibrio sp. JL13D10]|uniref:hypothetical protein n=1 Tax=Butyrivibrio sp. JL13D10 TaxID=3236815 RepID=UPI0038B4D73C
MINKPEKKILITKIIEISLAAVILSGCSRSVESKEEQGIFEPISEETENYEDTATGEADETENFTTEDYAEEDNTENVQTDEDSEVKNDTISDISRDISEAGILANASDINLTDSDGKGVNYAFTYNAEDFKASYRTDNWTIYDSYKINNMADMTIICQALIEVHQVHSRDMTGYREASDMAYEWMQHNVAYAALPDDSNLKSHAKDVDFNPEDQGKSFEEMYKDRTGKDLDVDDILTKEQQEKLIEGLKDMLQSGN